MSRLCRPFALVLGLVVLTLAALAAPAAAREEIRSFISNVTLLPDGSVDVIEVLDINVEGNEIRRGITRDIFTVLTNDDGTRLRSNLAVVSVKRDTRPEPYATEMIENGIRIRIGDADVFLEHRVHRFEIRYTMTRMARRFGDHDELYWNATGNYWDFPILAAAANVTLPAGAVIDRLIGYTGPVGSQEQSVTIRRNSESRATIRATRALPPGHGLTIAASFQKGILVEPGGTQGMLYWLSDHRDEILPGIAVFLVLLYNLFAWSSVGRDPAKGTIIPLFHPPKGYSPALAHFVHNMGWKQNGWTAFTASIFDLGVKGLVMIESVGKSLAITATGKQPESKLPPGETVLNNYFQAQRKVVVDKTTGPRLNEKRGEFVSTLETENRRVYFNNNYQYVLLGFLLSVLCLAGLVFFLVLDPAILVLCVIGGIAIGLFTVLFQRIWSGSGFSKFIIVIWVVIAGSNLFGGALNGLTSLSINTPVIAAVSIIVINVVFAVLMRAPTVQGRKIMDQIDGFKMYLDTAEKNRLNFVGEPQLTVKRFESILPFAIALGVEKPWSTRFENELARNAVPDAAGGYSPGWYHGGSGSFSPGRFSNTISAAAGSMSAAMAAAQPSSSSSSGFSGGGGSGGGGGGGGGGGW